MQDQQSPKISSVAIYARVSSEEQREGQTIDAQVLELERFANEKGWHVSGVYKDAGWSGTMLVRPDLDRLRDDAMNRAFDAVVINDVDRLARDVTHLNVIKRDLERRGVQVIFRKLPSDNSPLSSFMVNILGSFAEFERAMIIDRTRRGVRYKVEVRHMYLGCAAPYGYRYTRKDRGSGREGRLEVVPEEAAVVRQIFNWIDEEHLSVRKILFRLHQSGIPPRKGAPYWAHSTLIRLVHSETYCGVWHFGKNEAREPRTPQRRQAYRRKLKTSSHLRNPSEWVPIELPSDLRIIERPQWERVQIQLAKNAHFSPRFGRHEYLLSCLVKCGACSATFVGKPQKSVGIYSYTCHNICRKISAIREEYLDEAVWEGIRQALLNPTLISERLPTLRQISETVGQKRQTQIENIAALRLGLDAEEDRILAAYRTGQITPEQLTRELERLNARKASLSQEIGNPQPEAPVPFESVEAACKHLSGRLDRMNPHEKRELLRILIDKVVFYGDDAEIWGVLPINPEIRDPEVVSSGQSVLTTRNPQNQGHNGYLDPSLATPDPQNQGRNVPFRFTVPIVRKTCTHRFRSVAAK